MLRYLLPLLIGYTGGRMVYEDRGSVAGAIGTLGVIVGTQQPMFLGAMIMGPLSAWVLKKCDQVFQDKIRSGFEMIYNNFSLGILGMIAAIFAYFIIGPVMAWEVIGQVLVLMQLFEFIYYHLLTSLLNQLRSCS